MDNFIVISQVFAPGLRSSRSVSLSATSSRMIAVTTSSVTAWQADSRATGGGRLPHALCMLGRDSSPQKAPEADHPAECRGSGQRFRQPACISWHACHISSPSNITPLYNVIIQEVAMSYFIIVFLCSFGRPLRLVKTVLFISRVTTYQLTFKV